ncbi:MAG: FMN-binding protein, partial [Eubacterium sp.]|nr:FMN-binding protein [Eubacterium sp.]
ENFGGGVKKAETVAVDNAEEVADGYKITATSKKGFAGDITVAVVIGKDATVKSFEIVSSNETEGYGAKANEPDYAKQFAGLKADKITSVPSGANKDNNEIDAIAGATFTTKAVSSAVNEAIKYYQENYGDGLSESFSAEDDAAEEADASSSASPVAGKISISVNVKGE